MELQLMTMIERAMMSPSMSASMESPEKPMWVEFAESLEEARRINGPKIRS